MKYTYSVASNVLAQAVILSTLDKEIADSAIPIKSQGSSMVGDILEIEFAQALDPADKLLLDAVVWNHDPTVIEEIQLVRLDTDYDPSGRPIVSQGHRFVTESFRNRGYYFEAEDGVTSFFDVEITTQILLSSGMVKINGIDAAKYDKMDFSIVDINGVMGLHGLYGLTPGVDVIELKSFVKDISIPWWERSYTFSVEPGTVSQLVPGLFLRFAYHSNGDKRVPVILNYQWFEV